MTLLTIFGFMSLIPGRQYPTAINVESRRLQLSKRGPSSPFCIPQHSSSISQKQVRI